MTTFYQSDDTIAALATPPGEGGIAIIRISGKEAVCVADQIFSGKVASYDSHKAHLGAIMDGGRPIDEAMILVMRSPRSYTGEDVVELHCHGGSALSKKVLELAICYGARLAKPGEFTFRAFMNGKLDLCQAEAVQSLIGAKNEQAMIHAKRHLSGALSKKLTALQHDLLQVAAIVEAWVDFPEEGIEFASKSELLERLDHVEKAIDHLLNTFEDGKRLFHGVKLALVGAPNAGKSSLLNALVDEERAIVTDIPGTTRDVLHEEVMIGGYAYRLTDTAGMRQTEDKIEQEGIKRAQKAIDEADWILGVIDASQPLPKVVASLPENKTIFVFNKCDLVEKSPALDVPHQVALSAKTKENLDQLKKMLHACVWKQQLPDQGELVITSKRHKEALFDAKEGVTRVIEGFKLDVSPELLTADLRDSLQALGEVLGQDVTDEVLSKIFSTFCIGK